jgi:hypothetical protein
MPAFKSDRVEELHGVANFKLQPKPGRRNFLVKGGGRVFCIHEFQEERARTFF